MRQSAWVGIHQKAIHIMPDEFSRATRDSDDHRLAGRPSLQHDDTERFVTAWYDDDVAGAYQVEKLPTRHRIGENNGAYGAKLLGFAHDRLLFRTFTKDDESRVRIRRQHHRHR